MNNRGCLACNGSLRVLGRRRAYNYAWCEHCSTIQLQPVPEPGAVTSGYADDRYASADHGQESLEALRVRSAPYYQRICQTLVEHGVTGPVLDYGAGWGGLVETLSGAGLRAEGVELSHAMVADAQRRGLALRQGDLSVTRGQRFAAITMCGVFEHLADPGRFLADVRSQLAENGLLVTLQPTAPFAHLLARLGTRHGELPGALFVFDPPWHVALYSIAGMRALVAREGFDVLDVLPAPQGRWGGMAGTLQAVASAVNRVGWGLAGTAWPLLVAHIFVCRRRSVPVRSQPT